jgi:hypothetical protein
MKYLLLIFVLMSCSATMVAQWTKQVCILDVTVRNAETNNSRQASLQHALQVTGVSYLQEENLEVALNYPVVFIPRILETTFTQPERDSLQNYVASGGVVVSSVLRDTLLYNLFGVSSEVSADNRFSISFDTTAMPTLFYQMDDSLEVTVSLGRASQLVTFTSRSYQPVTATVLGMYDDGSNAFFVNQYGSGKAYLLGCDFRDVIFRNFIGADNNAHRTYSNGFEPTTDVFMFLLRNVCRIHVPQLVRCHTQPADAQTTVMITHDIDSGTALDTMWLFADLEQSRNIRCSYNITTRYFSDAWMAPFYLSSWNKIQYVKLKGHTLSSHSVGHFPDFYVDSIFPLGTTGNTPLNYNPYYNGVATVGGSILGELEVSKHLIETDHGVFVQGFRAGHLGYPKQLPLGLDTLGYLYNSTFSANDILTNFPFFAVNNKNFSGRVTNVLEIPMTISDVFSSNPINDTNYRQKVDVWTKVTRKNAANHAPTVLLIHPNRQYKVEAQRGFLDSLQQGVNIMPLEEYGAYWRNRLATPFSIVFSGDTLFIRLENWNVDSRLSYIVENDAQYLHIQFQDLNGTVLPFHRVPWQQGAGLYMSSYLLNHSGKETTMPDVMLKVYPNPSGGKFFLACPVCKGAQISIYSMTGALVYQSDFESNIERMEVSFPEPGMYIISVSNYEFTATSKILIR